MAYIANTARDTREMLDFIGVADVEELFADIPAKVRLGSAPAIPDALSEFETLRLMREWSALNRPAATAYASFIGAGCYDHFIPSAVNAIAQRGEILTAYTPYQAEASQGTLQIIFEFQSMICALTGMDVANASMYDGASALAEAVIMAVRVTGRSKVIFAEAVHPAYREVVVSYTKPQGIELLDITKGNSNFAEAAAFIIQRPNFFGFIEEMDSAIQAAREAGALVVVATNPMSLSVLSPPGEWGADIVVGEAQPIGLPMNFGGPYAGFFATKSEHMRKMPGRIVGRTEDHEGRGGFVLTLQTREQHIRRERATSNICTNQGLCATMVTLWLSLIGKTGFEKLGKLNLDHAGRLFDGLTKIKGIAPVSDAPFFNEFTVKLPISAQEFCSKMRANGILAGLPANKLGAFDPHWLIVCATETKLDSDLETYLAAAKKCVE